MRGRFASGVVALLISVSVAFAEDASPSVSAGSKAILFTFSGLSFLGASSYKNGLATESALAPNSIATNFVGGVGGKYFLNSAIGLRLGLQFGTAHQVIKTTLASGGTDGKASASLFGISIGGEYHLNLNKVSPFVGLQISYYNISTTILEPINAANGPKITHYNNGPNNAGLYIPGAAVFGFTPGSSFVPGLLGGVEFFVTKEISLCAEYQFDYNLTMEYESKTTTVTATGSTDNKVPVPGMSSMGFVNTGTLTLAVYF